jgi:hypothetical protein
MQHWCTTMGLSHLENVTSISDGLLYIKDATSRALWMAERLVPLLATQVARIRFLVPARPSFRVGKVAFFCYPASGSTFSSTDIEIIKCVKERKRHPKRTHTPLWRAH